MVFTVNYVTGDRRTGNLTIEQFHRCGKKAIDKQKRKGKPIHKLEAFLGLGIEKPWDSHPIAEQLRIEREDLLRKERKAREAVDDLIRETEPADFPSNRSEVEQEALMAQYREKKYSLVETPDEVDSSTPDADELRPAEQLPLSLEEAESNHYGAL